MKARHDYVATSLATIKGSKAKRAVVAAALGAAVAAGAAAPIATGVLHSATTAKCRHDTNGIYREAGAAR